MNTLMSRIAQREAPPPWGVGAALGTIIVAFIMVLIGSTLALALLGEDHSAASLAGWTIAAALIVAFVLGAQRRTGAQWRGLQLGPSRTPLLTVLGAGVAAALVMDGAGLALTGASPLAPEFLNPPEVITLYRQSGDSTVRALSVILMLLAQPVAEELVFRGVAQPAFRSAWGAWTGLLATAFLYGVFHFLVYRPAVQDAALLWYGLALPALAGLVFGVIRIHSGSTRAAVLAHAAFGLFVVLKVFFTL